jgi:hypothetical protein
MINSGVSEGRVLSPLLFALAFSIIWEKLRTSPFPDENYVFRATDFWLFAFADDLVVVASSIQKVHTQFEHSDLTIVSNITNIAKWKDRYA